MREAPKYNPRRQGDEGERSALIWFMEHGCDVFVPIGHSPDIDMIAFYDGRYCGIQVKTTSHFRKGRWTPMIATKGGNQSWSGVAKYFDATRCDYLFVVAGDGRRWLIPSDQVEGRHGLALGGPKYSEFEVERGRPLLHVVG